MVLVELERLPIARTLVCSMLRRLLNSQALIISEDKLRTSTAWSSSARRSIVSYRP